MTMKKFLQTKDAARLLDLSADMVRRMERSGQLKANRTESNTRLFERSDVEKLARERKAAKKS